jgi:RimJ/RimL family protein N-acetyltransferase
MAQLNTQARPLNQVPTLNTERLTLRPVKESDVPAVQKNFEDWDTVRFLNAAVPWPYPENGAAEWYKNILLPGQGESQWTWAICLKESPQQLIGVIELFREGRPSNRGFWLDRDYRGRGYMEEAANAVNEYAFMTLGFEKLYFDNALGNIASRRIKEKTGATLIRVDEAKFVDPSLTQLERWELTKESWQEYRSRVASQQLRS